MSTPPQFPPEVEYDELAQAPAANSTRTVAIIKNHALNNRFDIEPRILEANFEIVKERQMEFDTETDPETLYELFGEDADSLAEGPVWVYVLERRRAVEVWNTLMGDRDPAVARKNMPNSLRALYGLSLEQNGLMGSPDVQTAEVQIASLFASSPIYPTQELPDESSSLSFATQFPPGSLASSILSSMQRTTSDGYAPSSVTNPSTVGGRSPSHLNANGKPVFRARPLPATTLVPDIAPRTTKAAALRAGVVLEDTRKAPKVPPTKEQQKQAFMDVPGHKRSTSIAVASTAAPTVAPRMTKAAALRLGIKPSPKVVRRVSSDSTNSQTFDGVPGHKRRETIAVMSTKPPVVGPRQNRSAALRAEKDKAPPTSFQFKQPVGRTPSRTGLNSRPSSVQSTRSPPTARPPSLTSPDAPSKPRPRPSSLQAPTIAPRPNKSAQLRAAQKDAVNGKKPGARGVMA